MKWDGPAHTAISSPLALQQEHRKGRLPRTAGPKGAPPSCRDSCLPPQSGDRNREEDEGRTKQAAKRNVIPVGMGQISHPSPQAAHPSGQREPRGRELAVVLQVPTAAPGTASPLTWACFPQLQAHFQHRTVSTTAGGRSGGWGSWLRS